MKEILLKRAALLKNQIYVCSEQENVIEMLLEKLRNTKKVEDSLNTTILNMGEDRRIESAKAEITQQQLSARANTVWAERENFAYDVSRLQRMNARKSLLIRAQKKELKRERARNGISGETGQADSTSNETVGIPAKDAIGDVGTDPGLAASAHNL